MRFLKEYYSTAKLLFCSPFFWKKIFLYNQYPIFRTAEKKIMSRSSVIPKSFSNTSVKIYSGKSWHRRNVNKWMVGFKFGEFTWNRKLALYKAKQLKKKKNNLKFEQLLQIYWSRGFLYGGKVRNFNISVDNFFYENIGLAEKSKIKLIKRFELNFLFRNKEKTFTHLTLDQRKIINMYLSQLSSINNNIFEMIKYNFIRLYLIKTFRGRCHALGKPSRGQRTWSNSSTAYKCNRVIRIFIRQVKKNNVIEKKTESLNNKLMKKKIKKNLPKIKMVVIKKKKNLWF